jgi:hypothetical protein
MERKQLGMALRRLGLTYSEIRSVIPVPKGTLANWSRSVTLTDAQIAAIRDRTGPHTQRGIPRDTQWRRREEIEEIRRVARAFAGDIWKMHSSSAAWPCIGAKDPRPKIPST